MILFGKHEFDEKQEIIQRHADQLCSATLHPTHVDNKNGTVHHSPVFLYHQAMPFNQRENSSSKESHPFLQKVKRTSEGADVRFSKGIFMKKIFKKGYLYYTRQPPICQALLFNIYKKYIFKMQHFENSPYIHGIMLSFCGFHTNQHKFSFSAGICTSICGNGMEIPSRSNAFFTSSIKR